MSEHLCDLEERAESFNSIDVMLAMSEGSRLVKTVSEPFDVVRRKPVGSTPGERDGNGADDSARTYTVRSGGTLFGIAERFDTSVSAIVRSNPSITDPNVIRIGQVIDISL